MVSSEANIAGGLSAGEGGREGRRSNPQESHLSPLSSPTSFPGKGDHGLYCTHSLRASLSFVMTLLHSAVQEASAKRLLIGCVNASGKLRKE